MIRLPTDSDYITPLADDIANLTIVISDHQGRKDLSVCYFQITCTHYTLDAVVEVATSSLSGDEGDTIDLCARLSSATGDILRDIKVSFELTPDTAGTVTIAYIDPLHTVSLQILVTMLPWGVYRRLFQLDL